MKITIRAQQNQKTKCTLSVALIDWNKIRTWRDILVVAFSKLLELDAHLEYFVPDPSTFEPPARLVERADLVEEVGVDYTKVRKNRYL